MHPDHAHALESFSEPENAVARRLEVARQSGVPEAALRGYAQRIKELPSGVAKVIEPDRKLVAGVEIESNLGAWTVYETPGHAPSHVCLFQPDRRLLISGDHLLGRISLYYDYGWTPDPVGEFLRSLNVVDELGARLCLAGHGRPFFDAHRHVEGNRALVRQRLDAVCAALREKPRTVVEIVPEVYGEPLTAINAAWLLTQTLCYLRHLELAGKVSKLPDRTDQRWRRA
jgi:glyoxylase-like metal-dependent hydrolase (beta-lactamase superfamily II)